MIPESGGFDPAEVFALVARHRGIGMFAAPTIVRRLVDHAAAHGPSLEGLRTVVYGGGPMYVADLLRALDVMGPRFAQIYGQGESPMTITALARRIVNDRAHPRHLARMASVGLPQSGVEVAVRDEAGRDLPAGRIGEVCVRGAVVMSGYWGDARGHGEVPSRRLAVDGRPRRLRRGRVPGAQGPQQGPHHQRRLQHLPARGGGGAAHASRRGRGVGGRPPRPGVGGVRRRLRGGARERGLRPPSWTRTASRRSRASSGPRNTVSSTRCRRTTTARCSRPSCARACDEG